MTGQKPPTGNQRAVRDALCGALLGRGLLPRELPPAFSSSALCDAYTKKEISLPSADDRKKFSWTELCRYNLARCGSLRRPLSIPNPFWFTCLTDAVQRNWDALCGIHKQSELSLSIPVEGRTDDRAVRTQSHFTEITRRSASIRENARYIVQADISQFYSSIYTHTIPWAILGKDEAKKRFARGQSLVGDEIDRLIRSAQEGQTMGIPIGPDTSLIVAETLLCRVDLELQSSHLRLRGFRFLDDYEFGCTTLGEADRLLSHLQATLERYELRLNPRKTRVIDLPCAIEPEWRHFLRLAMATPTIGTQRNELRRLFDTAFDAASRDPESNAISYLLGRIARTPLFEENWPWLRQLLLHCAHAEPGCMGTVVDILRRASLAALPVPKEPLSVLIQTQIDRHAPCGHSSEVAQAIWCAIAFSIKLTTPCVKALLAMNDPICNVLLCDAVHRGLVRDGKKIISELCRQLSPSPLRSRDWLFAYEADVHGWIPASQRDFVSASSEPFFGALKRAGVRFYDGDRANYQSGIGIVSTPAESAKLRETPLASAGEAGERASSARRDRQDGAPPTDISPEAAYFGFF